MNDVGEMKRDSTRVCPSTPECDSSTASSVLFDSFQDIGASPQFVRLGGKDNKASDAMVNELRQEKEALEDALEDMELSNHAMETSIQSQLDRIQALEKENKILKESTLTNKVTEIRTENKQLQNQVKDVKANSRLDRANQENQQQKEHILSLQRELLNLKTMGDESPINDEQIRALRLAKKFVKQMSRMKELTVKSRPAAKSKTEWQLDEDASHCAHCKTRFGAFLRRHHCRVCGLVYCHTCCKTNILSYSPSKYNQQQKQNEMKERRERTCIGCNEAISTAKKERKMLQKALVDVGEELEGVFDNSSIIDSETDEEGED